MEEAAQFGISLHGVTRKHDVLLLVPVAAAINLKAMEASTSITAVDNTASVAFTADVSVIGFGTNCTQWTEFSVDIGDSQLLASSCARYLCILHSIRTKT